MADDSRSSNTLTKFIEFLAGSMLGAVLGIYFERLSTAMLLGLGSGALLLFLIALFFRQSRRLLILSLVGLLTGLIMVIAIVEMGLFQKPKDTPIVTVVASVSSPTPLAPSRSAPTTLPSNTTRPLPTTVPATSVPPVVAKPTDALRPTAAATNDEHSILQLVSGESEAFMQRNIDRLEAMWASDGVEVDANGTSSPSDDKIWKGWPAIRERYTNEFEYSYSVENTNIRVTITGDNATAVSDLKFSGTLLKDQDKWTFHKVGEQWKITSLTFNLAK